MRNKIKIIIFITVFLFGGVLFARADTTYTCYDTCSPAYSNWIGRVILDLQCNGSSPASYTGSLTVNGVSLSYIKTCIVASPGACGNRATTYANSVGDWPGGSVYCSNGSATSTPTFPNYGQTVSWNCNGVNGGSPSPLCSATKNLAIPQVQLLLNSPASVSLNNNSNTVSSKSADLSWDILNKIDACGTGCTCSASGPGWGGNKAYPDSQSVPVTIPTGIKTYTITCTNPSGVPGSDSKQVNVACDPFSWTDSTCNKLCGPGNYMQHNMNNLCVTTDSLGPACNDGNCPAGTSFEEVKP